MQETVSWKGHSFTLFVFVGIVMLCSIFFVLGMLVGRTHGQRAGEVPAPASRAKAPVQASADAPATVDSAPAHNRREEVVEKAAPPAEPPARESHAAPQTDPPSNALYYQIGAVARRDAAEKLLNDVRKRGFPALILAPSPGDSSPLYRVQVGPYANEVEAEMAKRKLESLKYRPLVKK